MANWDETRRVLLDWTGGSAQSEHLAVQVVAAEGFTDIDPSHPFGGPDGGADAVASKDGKRWVVASYFARGRKTFNAILNKFKLDLVGVAENDAHGIAFVTNQAISRSERETLLRLAGGNAEIFHLERITGILDRPDMALIRRRYLDLGDELGDLQRQVADGQKRLEGLQTGGDSFCYWMLYHFDMEGNFAQNFVVIRKGEFPLYDLRLRIRDMDLGADVLDQAWGELNSPASYLLLRWPLASRVYYRIFFHARNGNWHQDLYLEKSESAGCWLAATRVFTGNQREIALEHVELDPVPDGLWRS